MSLIHIPTGIRVQSQPTRSRAQNRVIARQILKERLDLMRVRGELPGQQEAAAEEEATEGVADGVAEGEAPMEEKELSRKEKLAAEARQWSKNELRWEKERRRKANRAKKVKRKKNREEDQATEEAEAEEESK